MKPPIRQSTTASTRNCRRMSLGRAPTAMRRPISRVRSVTDTSMMFMMPTPPTISDTRATNSNERVIVSDADPRALDISVMSRTPKSSGWPSLMWCRSCNRSVIWRMANGISSVELALHQDLVDVGEAGLLRVIHETERILSRVNAVLAAGIRLVQGVDRGGRGHRGSGGSAGGRTALVDVGEQAAADAGLDAGPRGQHDVVLIHAHHVGAAWAEHADDPEAHVLHADFSVQRRLVVEQLALDGLADQAHSRLVADVGIGERLAFLQVGPLAHVEEGRGGAVDVRAAPSSCWRRSPACACGPWWPRC